jgi:hypothetical protein
MLSPRANQARAEFYPNALERNALDLAVRLPIGDQPVALLDDLPTTLYGFAILLKQPVTLAQPILGSIERLVKLGVDVLRLAVWPRHVLSFSILSYQTYDIFQGVFALNND